MSDVQPSETSASPQNNDFRGDKSEPSDEKKPAPYYSLKNIVRTAQKDGAFSVDTLKTSADSVYHSKCFRTAFLWAAGLGGLFAAHRFKQGGTALRATNDGVLAAFATFGAQWYLCRIDEVDRRAALKAFYMQQSRKNSGANAPNASEDELGGEVDEDAIRREMERVTRYDLPEVRQGPTTSVQIR